MSHIYIIENIVNNKKYVGKTAHLNERKRKHFNSLKRGKHNNCYLQSSFNKHGIENFIFYTIEECEEVLSNEKEIFWIAHFKTLDKNKGYNLKEGGDRGAQTQKVKDLMSIIQNPNKKRVYGFTLLGDLVKEWDSIKDCSKDLKVSTSDVRRTIKEEQITCKNYILQEVANFIHRRSRKDKVKSKLRNPNGTFQNSQI